MAPVQSGQKWGFINLSGYLVIPAVYDGVKRFSEGFAACQVTGRWHYRDKDSQQPFDRSFFRARNFSEGLAAVKDYARSSWGYINKEGKTVIPAQFKSALRFRNGLAPVEKDGKWQYIRKDGSVALVTEFYRAYPFTADGLALVRPEQNGKYGYIGPDGSLKLPAKYDLGLAFTHGVAAVKLEGKWGFIDTKGVFVTLPTYEHASAFSENMAAVMEGNRFHYIGEGGRRVFHKSFDWAAPFSNGRALVLDNRTYKYVNRWGQDLCVAHAPERMVPRTSDSGSCKDYEAVHNAYQAGFVRFRIVNVDDQAWNISTKKTWTGSDCPSYQKMYDVLPGFPTQLGEAVSPIGYLSFVVHYVTAVCGEQPLFDITLQSDNPKTSLTLSSSVKYKPPPLPRTHPFWDFLKDAIDIFHGTVDLVEGNVFWGLYDYASGTYDIVSDAAGSGSTSNEMPDGDGTHFITTLSGVTGADDFTLNPLDGSFCGGDEYAITDGSSLVVETTATRSKSMPGEVALVIYRYDTFFAFRAAERLNDWRKDDSGKFLVPPYNGILSRVFANYSDTTDDHLCESKDGTQGYLAALSDFEPWQLLIFWDLANNFNFLCGQPIDKKQTQTYCDYFEKQLPLSCGN